MSQSGAPDPEPFKSLRQPGEGLAQLSLIQKTGSGQHQAGWQGSDPNQPPSLSEGTPVQLPLCKMEGSFCHYPRCSTQKLNGQGQIPLADQCSQVLFLVFSLPSETLHTFHIPLEIPHCIAVDFRQGAVNSASCTTGAITNQDVEHTAWHFACGKKQTQNRELERIPCARLGRVGRSEAEMVLCSYGKVMTEDSMRQRAVQPSAGLLPSLGIVSSTISPRVPLSQFFRTVMTTITHPLGDTGGNCVFVHLLEKTLNT